MRSCLRLALNCELPDTPQAVYRNRRQTKQFSQRVVRTFGRILTLGCAFVLLREARAEEFRGLWVDAFGPGFWNTQQVAKLVNDCRQYNFNAIFVQMRRRGDAFYFPKPPNQDPRTTVLSPDFDALAEIIRQCHDGTPRIEVHCWLVSHFVWAYHKPPPQPGHIYNRHRDWLTRDSVGQTMVGNGYYLDPGHPEANQWLRDVAVDVVSRYDVDGLHWDYFRYPGRDSGYSPMAIKRYKEEFGLSEEPAPDDPRFCEWRRRQVTDFLRWTTADLLQIKPQLIVSASVFANYRDSYDYRFADWVAWCREGILDVAIPMDFSSDNQNVFIPRAAFAFTNQGSRVIYMGQGAYLNSAENTLTQLGLCREMGFAGAVLYSYRVPVLEEKAETEGDAAEEGREVVVVDNAEANVTGVWRRGQFGKYHGHDYSFASGGGGANCVEFVPKLTNSGPYDVYEWHVAGENRAADVPFGIIHSDGTTALKVNQQRDGSRWNHLGRFSFATNSSHGVRVSDAVQNPSQVVIADAIRFVRAESADEPTPRQSVRQMESVESGTSADDFFGALKQRYQPAWTDVPPLPWKVDPANGIIKGCVTESTLGNPRYNAVVTLLTAPERTQKTEAHGMYAFFEVKPGTYAIKATAGQQGTATTNVQIRAGQVLEVNMALVP